MRIILHSNTITLIFKKVDKMIDAWFVLNNNMRVLSIHWENAQLEGLYRKEWQKFIQQDLPNIADIQMDKSARQLFWQKLCFEYTELITSNRTHYLLLKNRDENAHKNELLYQHTFDKILDGIQIYDQNACLVYLNQASREISNMPKHVNVTGMHLLDLYNLDDEISTTMTCLRTGAPVINRLDSFKSTGGSSIVSVNTGYPIFDHKQLLGAVVFEQNLPAINMQIAKLEEVKSTIKEKSGKYLSKFNGYNFSDLIGHNEALRASILLAEKIAPQECNVLLVGETGTGKEIFAQSIHKASDRKNKKFFAVNCAAIPDTLIESMFFGTSKGSFTGSVEKAGLVEELNGGTLFLDELNSMSLSMQSKLLRVIQEGAFRRVGGSQDIRTNIRFISSCNEDTGMLIEQNILRRDLFYRLSTIVIDIPPLRTRKDDIEELIEFYLNENISHYVKTIHGVTPQVLALLQKYDWPGNVRELFNTLDYVLNTIEGNNWIEIKHLPRYLQQLDEQPEKENRNLLPTTNTEIATKTAENIPIDTLFTGQGNSLQEILDQVEHTVIEQTLQQNRYNITRSAKLLGLSRQSLQYRMKKLGMDEF